MEIRLGSTYKEMTNGTCKMPLYFQLYWKINKFMTIQFEQSEYDKVKKLIGEQSEYDKVKN